MELVDKVLAADFAAKKNLLYMLKAQKLFFFILITSPSIYVSRNILNGGIGSHSHITAHNSPDYLFNLFAGKTFSFRFMIRPEIALKEANVYHKNYVKQIQEVSNNSKFKPYAWN